MEDDDLPSNLLRLMAQDEKQILPHQEVTEAINLETEKGRKKRSKNRDHIVARH